MISIAMGLFGISLVAFVWGLCADQGPMSPLFIGPLKGPILRLAYSSFFIGLLSLALAQSLQMPRLRGLSHRRFAVLFLSAAVCMTTGNIIGAFTGLWGHQIIYVFPRAVPVLVLRTAGFVLFGLALVTLAVMWFRSGSNRR